MNLVCFSSDKQNRTNGVKIIEKRLRMKILYNELFPCAVPALRPPSKAARRDADVTVKIYSWLLRG